MNERLFSQELVAKLDESLFQKSIVAKISWSHHVILINKLSHPGKRFWYMLNTIEHGNSRNTLAIQIESGLFERQVEAKKTTNFSRTIAAPHTDFANYIIKDPYIFNFVQPKEKADEKNMEQQLHKIIPTWYA